MIYFVTVNKCLPSSYDSRELLSCIKVVVLVLDNDAYFVLVSSSRMVCLLPFLTSSITEGPVLPVAMFVVFVSQYALFLFLNSLLLTSFNSILTFLDSGSDSSFIPSVRQISAFIIVFLRDNFSRSWKILSLLL